MIQPHDIFFQVQYKLEQVFFPFEKENEERKKANKSKKLNKSKTNDYQRKWGKQRKQIRNKGNPNEHKRKLTKRNFFPKS